MPTMMTVLRPRGVLSMRTLVVLLVALILGGLPQLTLVGSAAAEEPTSVANAQLMIYPEYDDPRLLVMLEGRVPPTVKLPVTVRFLVPAGAEMYSAGSMDSKGNYTGGPPDQKASNTAGWDEISYQLTTETFRIEYYHDAITGLPDKAIAYEFRTLYPIGALAIEVLQPPKATNFALTPASQAKGTIEGSLAVHRYNFSSVGVDRPIALSISYTKPDSNPIKPPLQAQAGSTNALAGSPNLTFILGIVGAVALAGGAIWYTGNRKRYRPAPRRTARPGQSFSGRTAPGRASASRPSPAGGRPAPKTAGRADFCRQCGTRQEGAAKYCRTCGARVG